MIRMSWKNTIRKDLRPEDYRERDARDAMMESSRIKDIDRRI